MKCRKCEKEFNIALASCGTGYSWSLYKCPHCGQLHAEGRIPDQVKKDKDIIFINENIGIGLDSLLETTTGSNSVNIGHPIFENRGDWECLECGKYYDMDGIGYSNPTYCPECTKIRRKMKEFETFNRKRGIDHRMRFSSAAQFRAYIEQEREDTWKAALEWMLKGLDYSQEHKEIKDKIYEELSDK